MLTDRQIRAAKPLGRPYKLADGHGLYLYVTPKGSRLWRLKYRLAGVEKVLSFGPYPEVGLADARERQALARTHLRQGQDPGAMKRTARLILAKERVTSFEAVARDWHARQTPRWVASHAAEVLASLERWLFPRLGAVAIMAIDPPMMLAALRAIEAEGALETCHRVRQRASSVFTYAIACGIGQSDPAAIVRGALAPIVDRQPMPALTNPKDLRALLRRTEKAPGSPVTKLALHLLALTACRSTEVRGARWEEFGGAGDEALWRIPATRMKSGREHMIPLVPEAAAIIEALRPFSGGSPYVFPNLHRIAAPMARGTLVGLLNRTGYGGVHCAHGFRAAFSSIMNERHPDAWDAVEAQLAHVVRGVRGAYLRAPFLERRRELLTEWAHLLLEGAPDAESLLLGPRR
jgi:integrase